MPESYRSLQNLQIHPRHSLFFTACRLALRSFRAQKSHKIEVGRAAGALNRLNIALPVGQLAKQAGDLPT
jgi:hypothetical protein